VEALERRRTAIMRWRVGPSGTRSVSSVDVLGSNIINATTIVADYSTDSGFVIKVDIHQSVKAPNPVFPADERVATPLFRDSLYI
jgi:hypothetical protein